MKWLINSLTRVGLRHRLSRQVPKLQDLKWNQSTKPTRLSPTTISQLGNVCMSNVCSRFQSFSCMCFHAYAHSYRIFTAIDTISPSLKHDCKGFCWTHEEDKVKTVLFQVARCADETVKLCPCLDMPSAPKASPERMLPSYIYFKRLHWGTDPKPTEASSLFTNRLQWHFRSGPNTVLIIKTKSK